MATLTIQDIIAALKNDPTLFEKLKDSESELSQSLPVYIAKGKGNGAVYPTEFLAVGNVAGQAVRLVTLGKPINRDGTPYQKKPRQPKSAQPKGRK